MGRAIKAIIHTTAFQHNLKRIKDLVSDRFLVAMIKANGYGHGLELVASSLAEADAFGVACIEEAMQLRKASFQNRILLMEGFFSSDELQDILHHRLEPVLHHWGQINALMNSQYGPFSVWVKVNTGMNRLGFSPEEFPKVMEVLGGSHSVQIQGLMTHFSSAHEIDSGKTEQQASLFFSLTASYPWVKKSLANSAAILLWRETHADCVRPGIMLYGASPIAGKTGLDFGLKPTMTLKSEIIAKRMLKKGDSVGYGGDFVCPEDMPIGIIAVGYGDGYPRHAPFGTPVYIQGEKLPLIGRISMDMAAVDLRSKNEIKIGDPVILWGEELPVEEVAKATGTIPYDLLTGLSSRVVREIEPTGCSVLKEQAEENISI